MTELTPEVLAELRATTTSRKVINGWQRGNYASAGELAAFEDAKHQAFHALPALLDIAEREAAARKRVEWQPIETAPECEAVLVIENAGDEPISAELDAWLGWCDNARGTMLAFEPRFWLPMPDSFALSPTEQERG